MVKFKDKNNSVNWREREREENKIVVIFKWKMI